MHQGPLQSHECVCQREEQPSWLTTQSVPFVDYGDLSPFKVYRDFVWAGPGQLASSANKVPSAKLAEDTVNSRFPKRDKTVSLDVI